MNAVSLVELMELFPDDTTARVWLEEQRWGEGNPDYCPLCGVIGDCWVLESKPGFFKCPSCLGEFTVRTGTVLQRSHIPLRKWVIGLWVFVTNRHGISSVHLAEVLGVRQATAWFMLQRLRLAAQDGMFTGGVVEADEVYIGGLEKNKHQWQKQDLGRGVVGKTPVVGLYARSTGQVHAEVVDDTSAETIQNFLHAHMTGEATLYSDEHRSYVGYPRHKAVNHSQGTYVADNGIHTNSVESVWAVLRRSLIGTYVSVSIKHLQLYVNEVCFRLTNGHQSIMGQMTQLYTQTLGKQLTYQQLTQ